MSSSLLTLLAPVRRSLLIAALLQAVAAVASIVPFLCVIEIARRLLADDPLGDLVLIALIAFGVRLVAQGASGQITHLADNTFQLEIRRRITAHLGRLPLGWFGGRHSGEVKRAVQDDVAAMHYMVAHSLPDLVAGVVAPLTALAYLITVDWRLTLVTLAPVAVFGALYITIVRGYSGRMAGHAAALGRVNAAVVELVQGIAVVKTYGGRSEHYRAATREFADFHEDWVRPIARRSALGELACSPPVMLLLVLGAGALLSDDAVDIAAFVLLGLGLTAPLLTLGYSAQGFRLAAEAAQRVQRLLAEPPLPQPSQSVAPTTSRIELDHAAFSYDGQFDVLREVTATLEPGTVTALVGASGAGKSTLAQLVPRFWDVKHGAVSVGGADVRDVGSDALYRHVAFVFQDAGLLNDTVRENIRLARPGASHDEVERAARAAQIHDRISALPRGYDSVIGDDARLSGGEEQRVAIARALLADRPILVLDEATAFADPESEAAIQDALSELAVGRTLIVIAHRLSTIAAADRILVLAGGRVVEQGVHDELLGADGEYARLWEAHA